MSKILTHQVKSSSSTTPEIPNLKCSKSMEIMFHVVRKIRDDDDKAIPLENVFEYVFFFFGFHTHISSINKTNIQYLCIHIFALYPYLLTY